jgi:hypothetical protein
MSRSKTRSILLGLVAVGLMGAVIALKLIGGRISLLHTGS